MPTASITDGNGLTINFNTIISIGSSYSSSSLFIGPRPMGGGQQVVDGTTKITIYNLFATLKSDSTYPGSGKSAYQKWEEFERLLYKNVKADNKTGVGYQRKLTYQKIDGSGTATINGKVYGRVSMDYVAGDDEIEIDVIFKFVPDDLSAQVS